MQRCKGFQYVFLCLWISHYVLKLKLHLLSMFKPVELLVLGLVQDLNQLSFV